MRLYSWYKHQLIKNTDISIPAFLKHSFVQDLINIYNDESASNFINKLDYKTQHDVKKLINYILYYKNNSVQILTKFWKRNDWAHLNVYLIISKKLFNSDQICWLNKNITNFLANFAITISDSFTIENIYENNANYILDIYRECSY